MSRTKQSFEDKCVPKPSLGTSRILRHLALALLLACTLDFNVHAEEPALPPGLGGDASDSEPALPPGLGTVSEGEAPALPPGLGGDSPGAEPALPAGLAEDAEDETEKEEGPKKKRLPEWLPEIHGFVEARYGMRTQRDPAHANPPMIGEGRLQLEAEKAWKRVQIDGTLDLIGDAVLVEPAADLRQLRLTWTINKYLDLRVGRQVLTWGTGDLLFINDLFPKDWQSYFVGRDVEYLKAPADTAKLGFYHDWVNVEFAYTPRFEPDRFITGERVSYWNPMFMRAFGDGDTVDYNAPRAWFKDSEYALRIYRSIGRFELALYGYVGHWKSPGGQRLIPFMQARFPRLNVYGASVRGAIGKGIVNAEIGYYDSRQDPGGSDMFINNSEFRVLLGYERELAKDFTAGAQYYLELIMNYSAYERSQILWLEPRDRDRHVLTLRLTKLLLDQNLSLSLFAYFSPSDLDAYLRPKVQYQIDDHWRVELGANIFTGESKPTFFGQFRTNTNVYVAARFSF